MEKQQNMRLGFNCKEYSPLQFPTVSYNKVRQPLGCLGRRFRSSIFQSLMKLEEESKDGEMVPWLTNLAMTMSKCISSSCFLQILGATHGGFEKKREKIMGL